MQLPGSENTSTALTDALRRLLRPLIRLLIEKGVTFPQFRDMLKSVYVEVAEEHFNLSDGPTSVSRIFVLTGIHRKDIKRLRRNDETTDPDNTSASNMGLGGYLVSRWTGDQRFLDLQGNPLNLPRTSPNGSPSFDELVESGTKDVRPRVILEEWRRLGIVHINDDNEICLNTTAFVPEHSFDEKAQYFGRHIHDHLATCANNLMAEKDPMFERSVYFSALTEASVAQLRALAEAKSLELLKNINQHALQLHTEDQGKPDATHRMRLGIYWYDKEKSSKP
ncbi:MAG TPA: hypothetical protein DCX54_11750 [Flavobacteriales bacterium]|nr:hypothetical protein [Flavobacteriales bacterium]